MNKQIYELKDSQTFETVFVGDENQCENFCENPDHKGIYEWWPVNDLERYRRKNNADDRRTNYSQLQASQE